MQQNQSVHASLMNLSSGLPPPETLKESLSNLLQSKQPRVVVKSEQTLRTQTPQNEPLTHGWRSLLQQYRQDAAEYAAELLALRRQNKELMQMKRAPTGLNSLRNLVEEARQSAAQQVNNTTSTANLFNVKVPEVEAARPIQQSQFTSTTNLAPQLHSQYTSTSNLAPQLQQFTSTSSLVQNVESPQRPTKQYQPTQPAVYQSSQPNVYQVAPSLNEQFIQTASGPMAIPAQPIPIRTFSAIQQPIVQPQQFQFLQPQYQFSTSPIHVVNTEYYQPSSFVQVPTAQTPSAPVQQQPIQQAVKVENVAKDKEPNLMELAEMSAAMTAAAVTNLLKDQQLQQLQQQNLQHNQQQNVQLNLEQNVQQNQQQNFQQNEQQKFPFNLQNNENTPAKAKSQIDAPWSMPVTPSAQWTTPTKSNLATGQASPWTAARTASIASVPRRARRRMSLFPIFSPKQKLERETSPLKWEPDEKYLELSVKEPPSQNSTVNKNDLRDLDRTILQLVRLQAHLPAVPQESHPLSGPVQTVHDALQNLYDQITNNNVNLSNPWHSRYDATFSALDTISHTFNTVIQNYNQLQSIHEHEIEANKHSADEADQIVKKLVESYEIRLKQTENQWKDEVSRLEKAKILAEQALKSVESQTVQRPQQEFVSSSRASPVIIQQNDQREADQVRHEHTLQELYASRQQLAQVTHQMDSMMHRLEQLENQVVEGERTASQFASERDQLANTMASHDAIANQYRDNIQQLQKQLMIQEALVQESQQENAQLRERLAHRATEEPFDENSDLLRTGGETNYAQRLERTVHSLQQQMAQSRVSNDFAAPSNVHVHSSPSESEITMVQEESWPQPQPPLHIPVQDSSWLFERFMKALNQQQPPTHNAAPRDLSEVSSDLDDSISAISFNTSPAVGAATNGQALDDEKQSQIFAAVAPLLGSLEKELTSLLHQHSALRRDNQALRESLHQLKETHEVQEQSWIRRMTASENEVNTLKNEKKQHEEWLHSYETQWFSAIGTTLASQKQHPFDLLGQVHQWRALITEKEEEIHSLKHDLEQIRAQYQEQLQWAQKLESELTDHHNRVQTLEKDSEQLKALNLKERQAHQIVVSELRHQLDAAEQRAGQLEDTRQSLEQSLRRITSTYKDIFA